jgi:hypothetical protein
MVASSWNAKGLVEVCKTVMELNMRSEETSKAVGPNVFNLLGGSIRIISIATR